MKMKILAQLKTKYEGVSDAILNRIADKLAKTVTKEEEVANSVEGVTFQQILESYGDSRSTEAAQSAVTNYEKKHGLKDGKVMGGEPIEPKDGDDDKDTPAWAKTLIASNKALSDKVAAMEGEKVATSRKQQVEALLEGLTEQQRKPYARIQLDSFTDEAFATELEGIKAETDEVRTQNTQQGVVITPAKSTTTPSSKQADAKEVGALADSFKI